MSVLKLGAQINRFEKIGDVYLVYLDIPREVKNAYTDGNLKKKFNVKQSIIPYSVYILTQTV